MPFLSPPRTPRLFDLTLPDLPLEAGARVSPHLVRGWWWGPADDLPWLHSRARVLSAPEADAAVLAPHRRDAGALRQLAGAARAPHAWLRPPEAATVLLVHALTGDARAGGEGGWWSPLIGPGRALDPTRLRLVCFNLLGSCYGTSGPADEAYPRRSGDGAPHASAPPDKGAFALPHDALPATLTPWDQARSILAALDALGLERIALVAGGSLGGMVALCLAALDPARFERLLPIAAAERASAWVLGFNHVARQAVLSDPTWREGGGRGLELARQLAMLTYRAEPGLELTQGRRHAGAPPPAGWTPGAPYAAQTYLEHQGQKLRARFDARSYLALLDAMDHHDLDRPPDAGTPAAAWGASRIQASTLAVGIDHDQLFPAAHMQRLAERLRGYGRHAEYAPLASRHGHDGFLIEWGALAPLVTRALALPAHAPRPHTHPARRAS